MMETATFAGSLSEDLLAYVFEISLRKLGLARDRLIGPRIVATAGKVP
jgi:hypothetical protein